VAQAALAEGTAVMEAKAGETVGTEAAERERVVAAVTVVEEADMVTEVGGMETEAMVVDEEEGEDLEAAAEGLAP